MVKREEHVMKAVCITGHGGNEMVEVTDRPAPSRQPGEVLVAMRAASLNRVDLYMRDSGAGITHRLPQVMGLDGAGVVQEVDPGEPLLQPGRRVVLHAGFGCGRCEFCSRGDDVLCTRLQLMGEHRDGTFCEWVSVPARNVFPIPDGLDFVEAACLGVNYLTAWRMLFTQGRLEPWETVLVFGIGGGVSLAAMQLAKAAGARVIVTSRDPDKLVRARGLGADEVVDSSRQDVARTALELTRGRGVDLVIENVGEAVWASAMKSLVRGGRLVTCGATSGDQPAADLRRIFIRQLRIIGSTYGNKDEFAAMLGFVERSGLRPVIDSCFPLEQIHDALDRLESGRQFGKVALRIGPA
jgi:NADPH:quinone reductase-like Zn-dependent oxidoreductase